MWSGMALFYFACLLFGFIFALIGALFGEIFSQGGVETGGHAEFGHGGQAEIGHGGQEIGSHAVDIGQTGTSNMPGVSVLNAITVSTFVGFFGIAGLVAVWGFHLGPIASLAMALPLSLLIAAGQFFLFVKVFVKAQASSEATMDDVLGCEATTTSTIPAGHVGQIAYVIRGCRFTAPAVSAEGDDIAIGAQVRIVNIKGSAYVVTPV